MVSRIEVYNLDGADFLTTAASALPARTLVLLHPPYYVKGQEMLYANYYGPKDHAHVARLVRSLRQPWVVSYDDHAEVRSLYDGCQSVAYDIAYSASARYRGREVAFFSDDLSVPDIVDPARLSASAMARYQRGA